MLRVLCDIPSEAPVDLVVRPPQPEDGLFGVGDVVLHPFRHLQEVLRALPAREEVPDVVTDHEQDVAGVVT